jgi:hypothetical protein
MSQALVAIILAASTLTAQTIGQPDPAIQKMLGEISRDRIAATMQKLASFETRGNFSDPNQRDRGIGAARLWISQQFNGYSPRLEVSFDPHKVKKQGTRILRDVEVVNVVAVLPGTTQAADRLIVGAH